MKTQYIWPESSVRHSFWNFLDREGPTTVTLWDIVLRLYLGAAVLYGRMM